LSENAAQEARDAFDRTTLLAEYIHTAASELYEKAINAQSADATDDMHFTMVLEWAEEIQEALRSKLNVYQLLRPAKKAMVPPNVQLPRLRQRLCVRRPRSCAS
jgi:hypothetical protein